MIASVRQHYNANFSDEKYQRFLADLNQSYDLKIKFRVAETPVFVPREFREKLVRASDEIIDFLVRDDFKKLTENAIPHNLLVPNETDHSLFLALDFAIVKDQAGALQPRLIEMQGFPSLFGFQDFLASKFKVHFELPPGFSSHLGLSPAAYKETLTRSLLGKHDPENVILLEVDPMEQNTAIDFVVTQHLTGIQPVNIGEVERVGRKLYYRKDGKRIPIHRIYNRVIFDELLKRTDLKLQFNLVEDVDVEWAGHPNWFFRISKYTMPLIRSAYIPECKFLSDYVEFPMDIENYVLKPLFSFSGSGIVFHISPGELDAIPPIERRNFILQRKVEYEPVIQTLDGRVKTEIRLLFLWDEQQQRPQLVTNLARLSRGEMIGVKFNKDKTWVGGSVCFFEP